MVDQQEGNDSSEALTYVYKVVYPGGTYIRSSPSIDADRVDSMPILEFGSIFTANKSVYLDGVNYVKLSDGRGWVFSNKGSTQVLDLLEVCPKLNEDRIENNQFHVTSSFKPLNLRDRSESLQWREARAQCKDCGDFSDFLHLANIHYHRYFNIEQNGSNRRSKIEDDESDLLRCVRAIARLIESDTEFSNPSDLEACLFVLAHMGSQVVFVMQLVVQAANAPFNENNSNQSCVSARYEVLEAAMEAGNKSRRLCADLARLRSEITFDDAKNFLQRWVIIQAARRGLLQRPANSSCTCSSCVRNKSLPEVEESSCSSECDLKDEQGLRGINSGSQYPPSYQSWIASLLCNPAHNSRQILSKRPLSANDRRTADWNFFMFNFVTNIANNTAAAAIGSIHQQENVQNAASSSSANDSSTTQTIIGGASAEDIPKEELMHLCMKMNKRMQAMESKGKDLVRRKATLLTERNKLLELMGTSSSLSILKDPTSNTNFSGGDQDLDLVGIEQSWLQWESARRESMLDLQHRLAAKDEELQLAINSAEIRHRKELSELAASIALKNSLPSEPTDAVPADDGNCVEVAALKAEVEAKQREYEILQSQYSEMRTRNLRNEAELERLRGLEAYLKDQAAGMEAAITEKNRIIEDVQKESEANKLKYEEKIVYLQMQLNNSRGKEENREKEFAAVKKQLESALASAEELRQAGQTSNEIVAALQARLVELEPELFQCKEKIKEQERLISAAAMMKVEHDALTSSLRRDLKVAFEERDDLLKKIRELEEFRSRSEGQLLKLAGLTEQAASLQSSLEDATSLITRLRSEAQASERNHAMRTAMLATCEAQVAQLQKEAAEKEDSYAESLLAAKTLRKEMEDLKFNASKREAELQAEIAALLAAEKEKAKAQKLVLDALSAQHERELEAIKREHLKKSSMARSLLSEREEEVRQLSARVAALTDEISSGAPSDRRIFELAQSQAKREATYGMQSTNRELAFQQLQSALAARDLDLARCQQLLTELTAEAVELRRCHQREGINMDYLKNIVVQYMTFPTQSSEKLSLVPVIAMLLQFSNKELADVQRANQEAIASMMSMSVVSIWSSPSPAALPSSKTPREIKPPRSGGGLNPVTSSASAGTATALTSLRNSSAAGTSSSSAAALSRSAADRGTLGRGAPSYSSSMSSSSDLRGQAAVAHRANQNQSLSGSSVDHPFHAGEGQTDGGGGLLSRLSDSDRDLQEKLDRINTDILSIHSSTYDENEQMSPPVTPQASPSQPGAQEKAQYYSL